MTTNSLTPIQQTVRILSERIVTAQRPMQILDAIKWTAEIKEAFFQQQGKALPKVDQTYYQNRPLSFDPQAKREEFHAIERDVHRLLGQFSGIGSLMARICHEYRIATYMLEYRGQKEFSDYAIELYGSSEDAFYPGGPVLNDLSTLLLTTLKSLSQNLNSELDEKKFNSEEAVSILNERLSPYFNHHEDNVVVLQSDDIIADAAAGARYIKMRKDALFSERDLRLLEVHEGWVHVGTSLNGINQPICTFLGKGTPSATITQEGLAVITEIFTFSSYPARVERITHRIKAINMAEHGANFLEVFNYFLQEGLDQDTAYNICVRVFRGSTPILGPFTKDLSYAKGFLLIYNYIRLAVQMGLSHNVATLFVGKLHLDDLQILSDLIAEGLVTPPRYVPPQFKDLAALSSWMCFSLFLNQLDLKKLADSYKQILHH